MKKIIVQVNGMVYDSSNPNCKCILSNSQNTLYAFIQVLDGDVTKRYWGLYDHDAQEDSIKEIMRWGGKWPTLPEPETTTL
ncbi:hypothetical protein F3H65_18420 [Klebsiella quasipneumoniae]|uniref:hypothetical protein n=1 Tax=Enterobacteriaceae TaxID=543 RepID=UPI0009B149B8|nr:MULTISPECIES: hypothetical protein [Enterobacteriaceae]EBH7464631.1 hypothetical protein [Salmonella enterica]ECN3190598.1 hypothetical protein [Salmonella enterica subsp. enterica serovar Newport]EEU4651417.1 hypothetical protein [Escherichia coli]ECI9258023.1 hypothetical protein [Salmonella enterica]ECV9632831.1 hypothetical protein [Salmonella enterica]